MTRLISTHFSTLLPRCLVLAACWIGVHAHAAGFAFIEVPAEKSDPALRGALWYPCAAAAGDIRLGPLVLRGVQDCAVAGTHLPLVVMSHGSGGSGLGNHDTAAALADAGFVVAAINHPGDNFRDRARQGELSIFASRSGDMRRLIDHMVDGWGANGRIDAARVGVFGFSRGGHTALALAGGVADFSRPFPMCAQAPQMPQMPMCAQIQSKTLPVTTAQRDARVKAIVIADPLGYFFSVDGLKAVTIPVQLWASEQGGDGLTPQSVRVLRDNMPAPPDFRSVEQAGHFAFLAPCPPALAAQEPMVCGDANGFDRLAFHADFNARVLAFFQSNLP